MLSRHQLQKQPLLFSRFHLRGVSLTELAIVLGVIGIVLGGVWSVASSVHSSRNVAQAVDEIQFIVTSIINLKQGQPFSISQGQAAGTLTNINQQMISQNVTPSWAVVNTTTLSHPWSTTGLNIYADGGGRGYTIELQNVPVDGCIGIIMQSTGCIPSQTGCPTQLIVGGGAQQLAGAAGGWQMTPAAAQALCAANGPFAISLQTNPFMASAYAAGSTGGGKKGALPNSLRLDFSL